MEFIVAKETDNLIYTRHHMSVTGGWMRMCDIA